MLEFLSATNHKKKTFIEFESLLEVKIHCVGEAFTPNADITTAKCLFDSVINTKFSKFLGLGIEYFYLDTNMDDYKHMWLPRWIFRQYFIYENNIEHLSINNRILVKICKGIYGLPQAGRLAYIVLIKHLQLHRYTRSGFTIGLFKYATGDTMFILVIDDFGVKYTAKNDALHFIDTPKKKYPGITIDSIGRISLGIHLY